MTGTVTLRGIEGAKSVKAEALDGSGKPLGEPIAGKKTAGGVGDPDRHASHHVVRRVRRSPIGAWTAPMPQMVLLSPVDGVPQFAQAKPDGIPNVYPGRYIIQVMRGFPRSYVESIKLGDTEVYDRPFDLWDGSQPIRITIRQGASIHGNVDNAWAGTVVVLDADENVTTKHSNMCSFSNSRFDVGPFRPGDYYVFAVDRPNPLGLTEVVMRALVPRAEKVHLESNGVSTLALKALPWPE